MWQSAVLGVEGARRREAGAGVPLALLAADVSERKITSFNRPPGHSEFEQLDALFEI